MQEPFYQGISDFIFMSDEPETADVILLPGGHYPEGALRAAQLYRDGYAPWILPSGPFRRVLTLPISRAVWESVSQKGMTVFL